MELEALKGFLAQRGVAYAEQSMPYGISLRCKTGEIFNWYSKRGTVVVQGRDSPLAQTIKAWVASGKSPEQQAEGGLPAPGPSKKIFIVYGHDTDARNELELLLHRMELEPIVLANLPAAGDTIIEKLERFLGDQGNVGFACVLLTPDDEGYPRDRPGELKYRARQNVILELGMVLARLGRKRVAILYKQTVERPSDIDGLIYIPFQERVEEVKANLFRDLREAGYSPDQQAL